MWGGRCQRQLARGGGGAARRMQPPPPGRRARRLAKLHFEPCTTHSRYPNQPAIMARLLRLALLLAAAAACTASAADAAGFTPPPFCGGKDCPRFTVVRRSKALGTRAAAVSTQPPPEHATVAAGCRLRRPTATKRAGAACRRWHSLAAPPRAGVSRPAVRCPPTLRPRRYDAAWWAWAHFSDVKDPDEAAMRVRLGLSQWGPAWGGALQPRGMATAVAPRSP